MKVSEAYPSDFLKAVDIGNNQVRVLISHVEMRDLGDDEKPDGFFPEQEKKVLSLQRHQLAQCHRAILRRRYGPPGQMAKQSCYLP